MRKPLFHNDVHSCHGPGQPTISHVHWKVRVDFKTRVLDCEAELIFDKGGRVALDTHNLRIRTVADRSGKKIKFTMGRANKILGSKLSFTVPAWSQAVVITYRTSPKAAGLQWLTSKQTGGKPCVYTQGEAIHTRSILPCQDTPSRKLTYDIDLTVPQELRGLVAANRNQGRTENSDGTATERWAMEYPIPSYLVAFTVGDYHYRKFSDRTGVWAEPHIIDKAADVFASSPEMLEVGEGLYGEYPFGRSDVLVLPKSFPYGGMENPCLIFLSPLIVDRSALRVVRHEKAHGWFGNLLTNATWADFWLNEGWTTWADGRMTEAMEGVEAAELYRMMLSRAFDRACKRWNEKGRPEMTALAPDVAGTDPDENFSVVPYFKGSMFIRLLEETVGRKAFDVFVRKYIDAFRFRSLTTKQFLGFAAKHLPKGTLKAVGARKWVYGPGLPVNAPVIKSALITEVMKYVESDELPPRQMGKRWLPAQWQLYLEMLKRPMSLELLKALDERFKLKEASAPNTRFRYALLAIESGCEQLVREETEDLLVTYGSLTYMDTYGALCKTPAGKTQAKRIFARARAGYHPISNGVAIRAMRDAGLKIK